MIDVHSVEFYVIAFVVAMALLTLLVGQRERGQATTDIGTYSLIATQGGHPGLLAITSEQADKVVITRTAIPLFEGDVVNVVSTVIDDKWHIVEKRGVKGRGPSREADAMLELTLPRLGRYHVRYDSEITGQWCTFVHTHRAGNSTNAELKY